MNDKASVYRCPRCHYLLDRSFMMSMGCRICGWVSPLVFGGRHVEVAYGEETVRVTMELDAEQRFEDVEATYRNGVLEVILKRAGW